MKSTKKLTEGALLLAIFAVLLLITVYLPVLGYITMLFLAVPFILFAGKNNRKHTIVFLVGAIFISGIVGTILSIPLALSYGLTGIVLGDFIREGKTRMEGYIAGSLVFLLTVIAQYVVMIVFLEVDFIKESIQLFEESMTRSVEMLNAIGQQPDPMMMEQFQNGMEMLEVIVPSMFVFASFIIVLIIQLVSFPVVKRFELSIPSWRPFKDLQLPKSLLWYYLLVLVASVIFTPEQGSYWYMALVNLTFILQFMMVIQGVSFVFYFSDYKELPKFLPIMITILTFFLPILLYIVRILGIIDLGFDLRKRLPQRK